MRDEYPRPHFKREQWQTLNGEWEFEFDKNEIGIIKKYYLGKIPFSKKINVPFSYQTKASGINEKEFCEVLWYKREFTLSEELKDKRILLCFNAVDYEANVWINGAFVTRHEGGYTAFEVDISDYLQEENTIVVQAIDRYDTTQSRGKQFWKQQTDRCWYHGTSGIWQSVWLEAVGDARLVNTQIITDIDTNTIKIEAETEGNADFLEIKIDYNGRMVKKLCVSIDGRFTKTTINLLEEDFIDEVHLWSPESPNIYNISYSLLKQGVVTDKVHAYFGMRKVSYDDSGRIYLNNKIYYQRLVLDQGYWEDSDLTPPSIEALKQDIIYCKQMGFNGARKHQKIEDPYYYYYADMLGFLVWAEMPSAYQFNFIEVQNIVCQYTEIIKKLFNFASIILWVPLNESWGVRKMLTSNEQKDFARSLYYLAKSLDPSRLVSTNDGWENIEQTDIISIHDYAAFGDEFGEKYKREKIDDLYAMGRKQMAHGEHYKSQPVIMTEYGGIALDEGIKNEAWGYNGSENRENFIKRLKSLNEGINKCDFAGFCYTQLTDVKQEVNGLLDCYHKPKFDIKVLAKIFDVIKG